MLYVTPFSLQDHCKLGLKISGSNKTQLFNFSGICSRLCVATVHWLKKRKKTLLLNHTADFNLLFLLSDVRLVWRILIGGFSLSRAQISSLCPSLWMKPLCKSQPIKFQRLTTEGRACILLANRRLRIPRVFPSTFPVVFHSQKKGKVEEGKMPFIKTCLSRNVFMAVFSVCSINNRYSLRKHHVVAAGLGTACGWLQSQKCT